jgi:hypothetical protein
MTRFTRRKPFPYKDSPAKVWKTKRRELSEVEKSFAVGALYFGATLDELVAYFDGDITKSGLSRLMKRTKERAEAMEKSLSDPSLYTLLLGRGRKVLLTEKQKQAIIRITVSSR